MEIPKGFCQCGCGKKTNIAPYSHPRHSLVKGEPYRFIYGHHLRGKTGKDCHNWNGGRIKTKRGYIMVSAPDHPRADSHRYVFEHIIVAEKALGKHLPQGAVIHHVNEDKTDNRPENLVICQDNGYHLLLHRRMNAIRACNHANWRKCQFCQQWDDPVNMYVRPDDNSAYHRSCYNTYRRKTRKTNSFHHMKGKPAVI